MNPSCLSVWLIGARLNGENFFCPFNSSSWTMYEWKFQSFLTEILKGWIDKGWFDFFRLWTVYLFVWLLPCRVRGEKQGRLGERKKRLVESCLQPEQLHRYHHHYNICLVAFRDAIFMCSYKIVCIGTVCVVGQHLCESLRNNFGATESSPQSKRAPHLALCCNFFLRTQ